MKANVREGSCGAAAPQGKGTATVKSLLMKSALRSASCLQALSLTGLAVGAIAVSAPAVAQDLTAGAITGTVTDEAGAAVSGATVTLTSDAQGFTRTATTSANGGFRFGGLQTGSYTLTVEAGDFDTFTANEVRVLASQTSELAIPLTTTGDVIVVTGARILQDFAGTGTGINVDVAELVKTVPLSRDLTSVALLAPGTSRGDTAFGNLASIGGASVAENAYYVNGLNITNFDNYLGAANVPFDFYRTIEVKSGGYPAEFGRATGGIVNTTTKSGSNEFFAAAHINWSPNFLRAPAKDLEEWDGTQYVRSTNREFDSVESRSLSLEAGGPVFEDRLFVYGLVEFRKNTSRTIDALGSTAYLRNEDTPFWGVKVDAYPIDGHHFEATVFDAQTITTRTDAGYSETDGVPNVGLGTSVTDFYSGGLSYVGKYTGNLTEWFTLSLAYGKMKDRFDNQGVAGAAGSPLFQNGSNEELFGVSNGGFYNGQRVTGTSFPYATQREFYRGDVDFYFSLFGDHHIRAGFDVEKNTLTESNVRNGGVSLYGAGLLTDAAYFANTGGIGGAGAAIIARPFTCGYAVGDDGICGTADDGNMVTTDGENIPISYEVNYFNSGGTFNAKNKAFYIQDEWEVTDRLTLNLGLRRDDFGVDRADGVGLVRLKENYSPRLGLTYDVVEDGQFKAFYGTYYLPVASNTAFRMTGYEYYIRERYVAAGVDSSGLPILGEQITNNPSYQTTCPISLTPDSDGVHCNVTGDGSVADPSALIAHNLKATKVREWLLGYEHNFRDVPFFGDLKVGLTYTNRRLLANAEDAAIDAAVNAWCAEEGLDCTTEDGDPIWTGFHQYTIMNPGQPLTVNLDGLDNREVTFTPEQLGYPAAIRKYDAVELTFDRPFDGTWSIGGSYTWSKSRGNSEGYVQSDFGQDDAGITQDFDQPGFLDGAYGLLPSHRKHRIKFWGAVSPYEGLVFGTNVAIDSPRPLSCLGYHPTDPYANQYGAASRYCLGVLSPRGTAQSSDWIYDADFKVAYTFEIPSGQTLRLRADVFNIFNAQGVQERNEIGESAEMVANPEFGLATSYQSPRSVRLGLDIEF